MCGAYILDKQSASPNFLHCLVVAFIFPVYSIAERNPEKDGQSHSAESTLQPRKAAVRKNITRDDRQFGC